jgi:hypothetical protein
MVDSTDSIAAAKEINSKSIIYASLVDCLVLFFAIQLRKSAS